MLGQHVHQEVTSITTNFLMRCFSDFSKFLSGRTVVTICRYFVRNSHLCDEDGVALGEISQIFFNGDPFSRVLRLLQALPYVHSDPPLGHSQTPPVNRILPRCLNTMVKRKILQ